MLIIGISGKMGSGKSTLADFLAERFGSKCVRLKFADPVYGAATAVQQYLNLPVEKDRALLQSIGLHYRQKMGPSFWAQRLINDIDSIAYNSDSIVIIDDLRFPEEFEALRSKGAFLVRLEADWNTRASRIGPKLFMNEDHPSETALDGEGRFHLIIDSSVCTPVESMRIVLESVGHNVL